MVPLPEAMSEAAAAVDTGRQRKKHKKKHKAKERDRDRPRKEKRHKTRDKDRGMFELPILPISAYGEAHAPNVGFCFSVTDMKALLALLGLFIGNCLNTCICTAWYLDMCQASLDFTMTCPTSMTMKCVVQMRTAKLELKLRKVQPKIIKLQMHTCMQETQLQLVHLSTYRKQTHA